MGFLRIICGVANWRVGGPAFYLLNGVPMVLTKLQILAIVFSGLCAGTQAADRPNILLILVDDMGYGDPGCYNPESKIPTPQIDRLASEGMRFTDAHAPGPLCHPSRYGLMTGR